MSISTKLESADPIVLCDINWGSTQTQIQTPGGDKKPIITVRANASQLFILNASFAKNENPNKVEINAISADTGLTSKWIRGWLTRKRRSRKKALGILAVKIEVGDPMLSASASTTTSVGLDHHSMIPSEPLQVLSAENVPAVVVPTTLATQVNPSSKKSPLSPSKQHTPYANQANKISPVVSLTAASRLNSYQPGPSTAFVHFAPPTRNSITSTTDLRENDEDNHDTTSDVTRTTPPFAISTLYTHDLPASDMLPTFNTTFDLNAHSLFNQIQPQIQDPFPFYSTTGGIMDINAFNSNTMKDSEERSNIRTQREMIATPPSPSFGTAMNMNLDFLPSPFAYLREDTADVGQAQKYLRTAVTSVPEVSMLTLAGPKSSSQPVIRQPEQYDSSPSKRFDPSLGPTSYLYSAMPTDLSALITRSNQTNGIDFSPRPASPYHLTIPNNRLIDKQIRDINADMINLTFRTLAEEEDTFTAAMMLVLLSKAGFEWDY